MSETAGAAKIVQAYRDHRPCLIDPAFRMLGDVGAAEDAVQDAFTRLLAADVGEIEDERGWLIVVTSRLCLDRIRSARARRERPHDSAEIEFVAPPAAGRLADPADRVTLDDSVSLALLVVLQRLSPAERVVFVLHDIFGIPFPTVAQTVGRAAPACRQLARRARQKIAEGQRGTRFDVASAEHRKVTERFIAACANGDLDGLLAVLAPDAWGDIDFGPAARCARWSTVPRGSPGTCCGSGARRRWSPSRWPGSPRYSGSGTVTWRAFWCSACAARRSSRSTSSQTPGSWPRSASSCPRSLNGRPWRPPSPSARPSRPYLCPGPLRPAARQGARDDRQRPAGTAPAGTAVAVRADRDAPDDPGAQPADAQGRHVRMAAEVRHVGRTSGRAYVTPAGARIAGDVAVIPLTFGNQSDWSKNVRAAGGCSLKVDGLLYTAVEPEFLDRREAGPLLAAAFGPVERAGFRMLGIRQYLRLRVVPVDQAG